MSTLRRTVRLAGLVACTTLIFALGGTAVPAAAEPLEIPLTNPGAPVELKASGLAAVFVIEVHDRDVVVVDTEEYREPWMDEEAMAEMERAVAERLGEGMRQLGETGFTVKASEEENRVRVRLVGDETRLVRIQVPRNTSVHATSVNGGDITVRGVSGEHELENVNGGIVATDVSGSLLAQTTNGDVKISLARLVPGKPLSFVTFNGDVDVTLPSDLAADVKLRSDLGEIFTDFDISVQPAAPAQAETRADGGYRLRQDKTVEATVGTGGTEVRLRTHNGDIFLRKQS